MESRIDAPGDEPGGSGDGSLKERLDKLAEDIKKLPPERIESLEKLIRASKKQVHSIQDVADILGVSKDTVRRAIKAGRLRAFQLVPRGMMYISQEELDRYLKGDERE
jgi:excisionase family DNA binding protein